MRVKYTRVNFRGKVNMSNPYALAIIMLYTSIRDNLRKVVYKEKVD